MLRFLDKLIQFVELFAQNQSASQQGADGKFSLVFILLHLQSCATVHLSIGAVTEQIITAISQSNDEFQTFIALIQQLIPRTVITNPA